MSLTCILPAKVWALVIFTVAAKLVWVMAWCSHVTSHYLHQCWPRSMWPYVISRPQIVEALLINFSVAGVRDPFLFRKTVYYNSWITFILYRFHCSFAVATAVEYVYMWYISTGNPRIGNSIYYSHDILPIRSFLPNRSTPKIYAILSVILHILLSLIEMHC